MIAGWAKAAIAIDTGNKWMDQARSAPYDTTVINDTLGRECFSTVLMRVLGVAGPSVQRGAAGPLQTSTGLFGGSCSTLATSSSAFLPFITYMDVMAVEADGAWNANEDLDAACRTSWRLDRLVVHCSRHNHRAGGHEKRIGCLKPGENRPSPQRQQGQPARLSWNRSKRRSPNWTPGSGALAPAAPVGPAPTTHSPLT